MKNRVHEIKKISHPDYCNHYTGKENPANTLSRGEILTSLNDQGLWWFGKPWPIKCENQWL